MATKARGPWARCVLAVGRRLHVLRFGAINRRPQRTKIGLPGFVPSCAAARRYSVVFLPLTMHPTHLARRCASRPTGPSQDRQLSSLQGCRPLAIAKIPGPRSSTCAARRTTTGFVARRAFPRRLCPAHLVPVHRRPHQGVTGTSKTEFYQTARKLARPQGPHDPWEHETKGRLAKKNLAVAEKIFLCNAPRRAGGRPRRRQPTGHGHTAIDAAAVFLKSLA